MKIKLTIIILVLPLIALAQITELPNGNVGIGNEDPKSKLDLGVAYSDPSVYPNKITLWSGGPNNYLGFGVSASDLDYFTNLNHRFHTGYSGSPGTEKMVIQYDGNVGIGTKTPKSTLDLGRGYGDPSAYPNKITLWSNGPNNYLGFGVSASDLDYFTNLNHRFHTGYSGSPGTEKMVIQHDGNVGIGTVAPTYRLEVNGTIRSKEVRVEPSPWPDFVFEDDYEFPTLPEVEAYIKKNKHLPGIPSANEVAEEGVALGEMSADLLQKIEELTLYTIRQQKEIERLKLVEKKVLQLEKLLVSKK